MERSPDMKGGILWSWSRQGASMRWRTQEELALLGDAIGVSAASLATAQRELDDVQSGFFEVVIRSTKTGLMVEGTVASGTVRRTVVAILRRCVGEAGPRIEVIDDLQVTAPFRPAHDGDLERYEIKGKAGNAVGAAKDDGPRIAMDSAGDRTRPSSPNVDVDRYPSISSDEQPVAGQIFRFEVALNAIPDAPDAERISFKDVPGDWQALDVEVEVHSSRLVFENGANRRTIEVRRERTTASASFSATVRSEGDATAPLQIVAMFAYANRHSGIVRRTFEVKRTDAAEARAGTWPVASVNLVSAANADLTVRIVRIDGSGNYMWSLIAPKGVGMGTPWREAMTNLGTDTGEYALGLLRECPGFAAGRHEGKLRGIGETIWAASPEAFKALYRDLRNTFGPAFPIQILTDEPHIPWEMMHPDGESGVVRPDHLFMTHPIARWFLRIEGRIPPRFEPGSIASFVPQYANDESLAMALDEGKWLAEHLGALPQDATYKGFTDFWSVGIPADPVAVLHFAGHGDTDDAGVAKIKMTDDWVSCNDVHGGVDLGVRYGTFVVLNACRVGTGDYRLGLSSGWASSLADRKFRGILAPLWAVQDECAALVVRKYLEEFIRGVPVGQAMLTARAGRRAVSATPYAYVVHGDVMAKIERAAAS
jgi:CHAT domain